MLGSIPFSSFLEAKIRNFRQVNCGGIRCCVDTANLRSARRGLDADDVAGGNCGVSFECCLDFT
jgi:hypothetical protein